jgi:plasmid stabilization system protein ParE
VAAGRLVVSEQAEADLDSITSYIAEQDGRLRAITIADRIRTAMDSLAFMPGIGSRRYYLKRNQRAFSVSPWTIFYEELPEGDGINVVRIADGRRDLPSLIGRNKKNR